MTDHTNPKPEPVRNTCGRGICAAEEGHDGTCDEASGWAEEASSQEAHDRASFASSDVRLVSPAQDAQDAPGATQSPFGYRSDPPALNGPQRGAERVSDAEAAEWERLAGEATEPVTATCIACGTRVPIDQSCPQCRATRATRARRARLRAASA